jgi:chromosome segregation ATPase
LAQNRQAHEDLQKTLQESQKQLEAQRGQCVAEQSKVQARASEVAALTKELAEARNRAEAESRQCRNLFAKIAELQHANNRLVTESEAAAGVLKEREGSVRSLDSLARKRQDEITRLGSLLESETAQRRQERARIQELEKQAAELNRQLAESKVQQQFSEQRQTQLEQALRTHAEQLSQSVSAVAALEAEISNLNRALDGLQGFQSKLWARTKELTSLEELTLDA